MFAIIHQKAPNPMQSGRKGVGKWVIEFPRAAAQIIDPLTGTTSSVDTLQQVDLVFDTKSDAIACAKRDGIAYQVIEMEKPKRISRSYAENFSFDRKFPWTH